MKQMLTESETAAVRRAITGACESRGCSVRSLAELVEICGDIDDPAKWLDNRMYACKRLSWDHAILLLDLALLILGRQRRYDAARGIVSSIYEAIRTKYQEPARAKMLVFEGESVSAARDLSDRLARSLFPSMGAKNRAALRSEIEAYFREYEHFARTKVGRDVIAELRTSFGGTLDAFAGHGEAISRVISNLKAGLGPMLDVWQSWERKNATTVNRLSTRNSENRRN